MPATVWKGYLSFGLVTFPVRLFSAARAKTIHFHMLHRKDLARIKEVWYCSEEDKPVDRSEIVKGFETKKNEYVVVEDEELKAIAPPTASTIEIQQFVKNGEVDPVYYETSYYLAAEEKTNKAYALFSAALAESKREAIAKVAMHNREHMVLIRPSEGGLLLHTLFYADEINAANRGEQPKTKYSAKELDLAKTLLDRMSEPFHPEKFHDEYRERLAQLIEQKKKGEKIIAQPPRRKAPVIDLMEALKRSLKSEARPPSSKQQPAAAKKSAKRKRAA